MSVSGIESVTGLGGASLVGNAAGLPAGMPYGAGAAGGAVGTTAAATPAGAFAAALSAQAPTGVTGPTGPGLAATVTHGIEGLEAMNDRTDRLAVGAATGDLGAIHDYTIAATETSVATQLTVAVRNKAVEAFTEIMRMQV